MRRPLWATGPQEPPPPAPPPAYVPPPSYAPPPPPVATVPPEAPPSYRPPKQATSPLFQTPPEAPQYSVPQPAGTPKWLLGVASGVIIVLIVLAIYWFFGRSQTTSAVIETPAAAKTTAAGENPLQKYIEVTGIRFSPMTKGVQVAFEIINHSDSDIVGLAGTATILAKTDKGDETPVGTVDFQTSMPAKSSKELQLPFTTRMKIMELPDWQYVDVKVKITGPNASGPA